ncbi:MAG: DNA-dependent RNA polymerase II, partial [Watsoniomyces obsoletus]
MLKSSTCHLRPDGDFTADSDLFAWGECPFDQGGYFIINGSEKVLIAQERSAGNIVQVFKKPEPSPVSCLAEIRSVLDTGNRQMSQCTVKMYRRGDGPDGGALRNLIRVQLPYTKTDVPLVILFRALGIVSDSDILAKICYDQNDKEMMEILMPSLAEGQPIQEAEMAKDWIGKRGTNPTARRFERLKLTTDILQKEWLPHIGKGPDALTRKAYFLGYMVNRLL